MNAVTFENFGETGNNSLDGLKELNPAELDLVVGGELLENWSVAMGALGGAVAGGIVGGPLGALVGAAAGAIVGAEVYEYVESL